MAADVDAENMEIEMEIEGGSVEAQPQLVEAQPQPSIELDLERKMTEKEMSELSGILSIEVLE